jgi:hypothetical protein
MITDYKDRLPFLAACIMFGLSASFRDWEVVVGMAPFILYMAIRQALHDHTRICGTVTVERE